MLKYNKKFNTKEEFIDFVKWQVNVDLNSKKDDEYIHNKNNKEHILYTKIERHNRFQVLDLIKNILDLRVEEHLDNYYWIWIKDKEKN